MATIYLLYEKSQFLDMFKNFKADVENQLGKRIKSVRFDPGSAMVYMMVYVNNIQDRLLNS